jgi:hypothetical protein
MEVDGTRRLERNDCDNNNDNIMFYVYSYYAEHGRRINRNEYWSSSEYYAAPVSRPVLNSPRSEWRTATAFVFI